MTIQRTYRKQQSQDGTRASTRTPQAQTDANDQEALDAILKHGVQTPQTVAALQRKIGNQATAQYLQRTAAKPAVNQLASTDVAKYSIQRDDGTPGGGFNWSDKFATVASLFAGANRQIVNSMGGQATRGMGRQAMRVAPGATLAYMLYRGFSKMRDDPSQENVTDLGRTLVGARFPGFGLASDAYDTSQMFNEDKDKD